MSLLAPLGLLGLIGIIALIIIYIIKPNYQSKFITSTFIWKLSLKYKKKKIPISKLRNILIFICQVLIITAAAFILAKPFIDNSEHIENGDTVIILDSSASMHTEINGNTRFRKAVTKALTDAEEAFENGNKVTVILASDTAEFVAQQLVSDQSQQLYDAMQLMLTAPTNYYTYGNPDIDGAMSLAEQITSYTENVSVTLYTDMTYYENGEVEVYNVCDVAEWNAAILDVRAIPVENYYRIEIDVASYGKDENVRVDCEISDYNDSDAPLKLDAVATCIGDQVTTLVFAHVPDGDDNSMTEAERELITLDVDISSFAQLYVSISESDSLSYDNQFYLYGGEKPTINVLYYSTLPNNYFTSALLIVQDALRDDWNLQITEKREGDPIIEGYDLYIYEHNMPKTLPTDGVVFCVNPKSLPSSAGVKMGALAQSSSGNEVFASAGETHPIMNNINASYISITQFYTISTYDGYTPLVTVKDDPLLLVRDEPDSKIVVMPFSLHYSNLALLPEFPLLLLNMVNHFFPTTVDEYVFETGDSIDLNARGPFIEVSGPGVNKTIEKLPASLEVKAPGTYTFIQYPISGTPAVESVYVRIPESESNINLIEPTLTNPYFYTDTGASNIDLLFYFALAMVALLFLEWWLKSREQI